MDWVFVKVKGDMIVLVVGLMGEYYVEIEYFDWKKMCISGVFDGL